MWVATGYSSKIFVSHITNMTVDESNSARVLVGCKPTNHRYMKLSCKCARPHLKTVARIATTLKTVARIAIPAPKYLVKCKYFTYCELNLALLFNQIQSVDIMMIMENS